MSTKQKMLYGKTLKGAVNYTVTYENNVEIGTATVTVKGKGKYTGSVKATFKIRGLLKNAELTVEDQIYTGKALKPGMTVKLNGKTLKKGTDYTVTYRNNIEIGTATVTVKGKGNYASKAKATFAIKPAKVVDPKIRE